MANNTLTIGVVAGLALAAFLLVLAIGGANENLDGFSDDNISVEIDTKEGGVILTPNEEGTPRGWVVRVLDDGEYRWIISQRFSGPLWFPYDGETYLVTYSISPGNSVYYIIDTAKNTISSTTEKPI